MLCRLCWRAGSVGYPLALLSSQNPREIVGEEVLGLGGTLADPGRRTSRRALAPQLIRRTKGLLGLPEADSESSMALSSCTEDTDEIEETDPRRKAKVPGA